jgi:hypothetical protein
MEQLATLLEFFRVLGNESRLKIVGLLANREYSVGDLAAAMELREPTVSHHLAKLKELELVDVRADGNNRFYRLNAKTLERLNKNIFSVEQMASLVADGSQDEDARILKNFMDGERIKSIPAQYKKQLVVLRWLAERFEHGRRYPEAEVNEIIKRHHPDSASWRRSMIEEGYMARENGIYWRLPDKG